MELAKTLRTMALLAIPSATALCASAAPVSAEEAAAAVGNWLKSGQTMGCTGMGDVADVRSYDGKNSVGKFYVISLKNDAGEASGYVVTSADRKLNPIIAYSDDGAFEATDENPLWPMLTIDVSAVTSDLEEMESAQASKTGKRLLAAAPQTENERQWSELLGERASGSSRPTLCGTSHGGMADYNIRVNTLLTTKWNQSGNGENYYTPKNRVCGCVATAGAQILYYWKWPQSSITAKRNYSGTIDKTLKWDINSGYETTSGGERTAWNPAFGGTYDWAGVTSSSSTTKKKAIGKLTRDVGLSCYMNYAAGGSSSQYQLFTLRLTDQFGYKNAVVKIKPSAKEVTRALVASLDLKSPCGVGVPGHAIVADGYGYYQGDLFVHFNMGWGGSKNAWYNPPDLSDANSKYTSIEKIIYNIYPPSVCSASGRTIVSGRILDGSGSAIANATVTARNRSTGATYSATTDSKGIYALLVPPASYTISSAQGYNSASTNLTASACESTKIYESGAYSSGGSVHDLPNIDLRLALIAEAVAPPVMAPKSGTMFFRDNQPVALSCPDGEADIRYTLDGSEPTESSALYKGLICISSNTTVKARAFKEGYYASEVTTAQYVRGAIIGENIVLNTSPSQGETLALAIPMAGTYDVSFSYSGVSGRYGESIELRLAQGGSTNTLAAVAAASAGTFSTNFAYDVSAAGIYELIVHNPSAGTTQPVAISGLSISIPVTEENARRYWVCENPLTLGVTGAWAEQPASANGLLDSLGGNVFTPKTSPAGRMLTYTSKVGLMTGNDIPELSGGKKAAAALHYDEHDQPTFALLTSSGDVRKWVDVSAEGLAAPQSGVEYAISFILDCSNRTYRATIDVDGEPRPLADANGKTVFAFADGSTPVGGVVGFMDCSEATALVGSYYEAVKFAAGDVVPLHGGGTATLNEAQAAWLNAMDDYSAVSEKLSGMNYAELEEAWLLNLDLTEEDPALVSFMITGIDVLGETVKIGVSLVRRGTMKPTKINGVLRLYGGEEPNDMHLLSATPVGASDFGGGISAELTFPRSGSARFFRAVIDAP